MQSVSFGRWFGIELKDDGPRQIYMAPGFAHGFCVLSASADIHYKVSRIYEPGDEGGVLWNDPDIGIAWPIAAPVISAHDAARPRLRALGRLDLPHAGSPV
jgi:dTDP-4-dehydrorhamnose 3,5-epimerase